MVFIWRAALGKLLRLTLFMTNFFIPQGVTAQNLNYFAIENCRALSWPCRYPAAGRIWQACDEGNNDIGLQFCCNPSTMTTTIEELRSDISELKNLETNLGSAKWNDTSPRGVVESNALLERYQAARDLYLKRRLETLLVDHVSTFDGNTFEFPDFNEDEELEERHVQALATLQTSVQTIETKVSQLRDTYRAVCSRREELEKMVQDLEEDGDEIMDDTEDQEEISDEDMAFEQERMEQLQQTKRRLQEELAKIQEESQQARERVRHRQEDIALLQKEELEDPRDSTELKKKVEELREMKVFYDSLREVLEELGGVKILEVKEEPKNRHLHLTLLLYNEHKIQIELEVYRQIALKLVNATWLSKPVVAAKVDGESENFFLGMESLDDLVSVAKTTLGPPHDMRFIIREVLARIRIQQNRVNDLALLRRRVLTKIVGSDQVVCSLNDGIVIVMRLYEHLVRVEQVVGVSGWNQAATDKVQAAITHGESTTPTSIVAEVQAEIERLKQVGVVNPRTPTMPKRKEGV